MADYDTLDYIPVIGDIYRYGKLGWKIGSWLSNDSDNYNNGILSQMAGHINNAANADNVIEAMDEITLAAQKVDDIDKTKPIETNGKHPPLTILFNAMINFIKATSTESDHVRIVSNEQCNFKSGDIVKVIDGEFKGVTGKVARIAGQQRVVVEVVGGCMVATAYIPNVFLEVCKG